MRRLLVVLAVSVAALLGASAVSGQEPQGEWAIPKDPSKFHLFVCLGQSNMAGGFKESHLYNDDGQYDPVTDPAPRVLVFRSGGWKPAAHPLIKHNKVSFSLPIPFAKKYLELLGDPEVKVGLITSAYGGKQIGFFVKGNAMYPGGLARHKQTGVFKGVLWHQGESDTTGYDRFLTYKEDLLGIVRSIRSDLDMPELPFVTGQLSRMASNTLPRKDDPAGEFCGTITRALADIGDDIPRAAHVRSTDCGLCVEHVRHLVDDKGKPTGQTMRMPDNTIHFNRSGLTTLAHRYARAILDYPSFKNDPVRLLGVPGRVLDASLVREVSDLSRDKLTFAAQGLPDWLTVKPDGSVRAMPPAIGEYKGSLTVTDRSGQVDRVGLVVHVQAAAPPEFKADALERLPVVPGLPFRDAVRYGFYKTVTSDLFEPNNDPLTYSKVDGPDWLEVSADGTFSGTPPASQAGKTVTFTVKVADPDGSDTARYSMKVLEKGTIWYDGFDYLPDIRCRNVDKTYALTARSPKGVYFPGVPIRGGKQNISNLHVSFSAPAQKFGAGELRSFSTLVDEKRFSGKAGAYRFRFRQFGIGQYAHLFVSLYAVNFGQSPQAVVSVTAEDRLYGVPAPVEAKGGARLRKVAERNFRDTKEAGVRELDFQYDGTGDVLLVFSVSVPKEDLARIETEDLSRSQKRKRQRETGGNPPPAFNQTGADLDDFGIVRLAD
ncbi:MAG: putative Ig domain protein [Planctomycetes bacterium ADurb.Bin126]|nr:MAG: putative Ig domain protein [Planctomycetes bacterium ADurb.Bin126]HOD80485.1 sialate O-acetylesterase [Phycisphaerae bacterium]HQL72097.1 sialate O-acetylesterase [Phycisphaerae bacterium]